MLEALKRWLYSPSILTPATTAMILARVAQARKEALEP